MEELNLISTLCDDRIMVGVRMSLIAPAVTSAWYARKDSHTGKQSEYSSDAWSHTLHSQA